MSPKVKLALWEAVCVVWVCLIGALLHFAFELSDYWTPMAVLAAVNESAWEHTKMYFWPGLFFALAQYTYTRHIHNNYWQGKAAALILTPLLIFVMYYGYMAYIDMVDKKANLAAMLSIMVIAVSIAQYVSYRFLTAEPRDSAIGRYAGASMAALAAIYVVTTFYPPQVFLFENFFCYTYTGEYGILEDYEPYRIFTASEESMATRVNYCANIETN